MVPVCNDFFRATTLNRPAWQSRSGNYLALIKEKEVQLYERDSWNMKYQLTDPDIKKVFENHYSFLLTTLIAINFLFF